MVPAPKQYQMYPILVHGQYWDPRNKSTLSETNEWLMNFGKLPRTQKGRVVFSADSVNETEFLHREE